LKLAASNIAWTPDDNFEAYSALAEAGFSGLEVAPTRFVPEVPYSAKNLQKAQDFAEVAFNQATLRICSVQSIWFGRDEQIFGSQSERDFLLAHTRGAIDFAVALGSPHIVFGSPKNRKRKDSQDVGIGHEFLAACSYYAETKGVTIGLEASPKSYGANYITSTFEALLLVQSINSPSLKINLDLGAVIENREPISELASVLPFTSHVHVSEPHLRAVVDRAEHDELRRILTDGGYSGWVSLEMAPAELPTLKKSLNVVASAFSAE
jgi:sugar phosphate isomerase/epimerase